jgi:hypothetical protein
MAGRPRRRAAVAEAQLSILTTFVTALAEGRTTRSKPVILAATKVLANLTAHQKACNVKGKKRLFIAGIGKAAEQHMTA